MAEDVKKSDMYFDIPLALIIVEEQIRRGIDMQGESFKAFAESIREKGILEPVIVTPKDGKYLLISGERRFLAAQQLGLATIPACVRDGIMTKDEALALQLTENLQREDLNPIDEAQAYLQYANTQTAGTGIDDLINVIILRMVDPSRVDQKDVSTVDTVAKISGKSLGSIRNILTLLKLPEEMKSAVRDGRIPVSQGYIFAANLDNSGLMETFDSILLKPMTNAELTNKLASYKKVKRDLSGMKPKPLAKYFQNVRAMKTGLEKGKGPYSPDDLTKLLDNLRALCTVVEAKLQGTQTPAEGGLA